MSNNVKITSKGIQKILRNYNPKLSLSEFIWNGFDAKAHKAGWLFCGRQSNARVKALIHLEDVHLAQAINYLEAYGLRIGLLVNFGAKSLEFKRVMKPI